MKNLVELADFEAIDWRDRYPEQSSYDIIRHSAETYPDNIAMIFLLSATLEEDPLKCSYRDFMTAINQTANALAHHGIEPGSACSIILPNLPHTHFALWGCQALGIAGPINPMLEPQAIRDIMLASESRALICLGPTAESDIWEKVFRVVDDIPGLELILQVNPFGKPADFRDQSPGGIPIIDFDNALRAQNGSCLDFTRAIGPRDIASYFHTGGTTGTPKLAQHTHANQVFMTGSLNDFVGIDEHDVSLAGLPLFHVNAAFISGLNVFRAGACALYATPAGYRNPTVIANIWKLVEKYRVSYFSAVPTLLASLLDVPVDGADLQSLRFVVCGAAPLSTELFRQFRDKTGVELVEGYGMTEGTCCSAANPIQGEKRIGSIGIHLPYQQLRCAIFDDDNRFVRDCASDEVGNLLIKGPNVFCGYKQADKNRGVFHDDWLNSGDLARIDADGYVWLTGRAKDLIIRGGHNIDPKIIEDCLSGHTAVALVAAVGQPDNYAGELPCAYVTLKHSARATPDELLQHAKKHIVERAAIPVHIEICTSLPTTAVGKIFKPELRRMASERVIRQVLADAGIEASVQVSDDKQRGTVASISARPAHHQAIRETLAGLALAVELQD